MSVLTASRSSPLPEIGPSVFTFSSSDGPGTYSLTMYGRPAKMPVPAILAVQNPATRAATSASRRNRRQLFGSAAHWGSRILIATRMPLGASPR